MPAARHTMKVEQQPVRFMGIEEVARLMSLSKRTLQRLVREDAFPHPRRLGANRIAWRSDEVRAHIMSLPEVPRGLLDRV